MKHYELKNVGRHKDKGVEVYGNDAEDKVTVWINTSNRIELDVMDAVEVSCNITRAISDIHRRKETSKSLMIQCKRQWSIQAKCRYADGKGHCVAPPENDCKHLNSIIAPDRTDGKPYVWGLKNKGSR